MQQKAEAPHIVGYATFVKVWIALVVLTGLLVGLSVTHRPNLALLGLLVITPTKASWFSSTSCTSSTRVRPSSTWSPRPLPC